MLNYLLRKKIREKHKLCQTDLSFKMRKRERAREREEMRERTNEREKERERERRKKRGEKRDSRNMTHNSVTICGSYSGDNGVHWGVLVNGLGV